MGIRLSRRGLALTIGLGAVVLTGVPVGAYALTGTGKPKPAASTVARVQRGTVTMSAGAAGTVQGVDMIGLSFSMSGVVTELGVRAGDSVSAGQVLARIDSSDAQDSVDSAQSSVNAAQDALTRAEAPSPTPTCQAGGLRAEGAAYRLWPTPTASTSPSGSPSASPSASARPSPNPSRPTGNGGSGGCTTGGTNNSGRGGSGTDALFQAQQQLNNANLALEQARLKLAGTVISAPTAGRVLSVAGTVGSQEAPGSSGFIVLNGANGVAVEARFSEADVAHLAVGQPTKITLPNRAGDPLTGKVSHIDPAGTLTGRLVRYGVEIVFDTPPDDLLFGQSATVAVVTAAVDDVLYLPSAAVTSVNGSTGSVTVRVDGKDSRRTVRLGLRGDQYTEIRSGLAEGDLVVVS
jgi:multidrug efflux pump subunit AcrA (membrane-fusion protein)